jgi:hypothetical protein
MLTISDNGSGSGENAEPGGGSRLIAGLVTQLRGKSEVTSSERGTTLTVTFWRGPPDRLSDSPVLPVLLTSTGLLLSTVESNFMPVAIWRLHIGQGTLEGPSRSIGSHSLGGICNKACIRADGNYYRRAASPSNRRSGPCGSPWLGLDARLLSLAPPPSRLGARPLDPCAPGFPLGS